MSYNIFIHFCSSSAWNAMNNCKLQSKSSVVSLPCLQVYLQLRSHSSTSFKNQPQNRELGVILISAPTLRTFTEPCKDQGNCLLKWDKAYLLSGVREAGGIHTKYTANPSNSAPVCPLSYLHVKSFITFVKVNILQRSFYVQCQDSKNTSVNKG